MGKKKDENVRNIYVKLDKLITIGDLEGINEIVSSSLQKNNMKEMRAVLSYTAIYKNEVKNWNKLFERVNAKPANICDKVKKLLRFL